MADDIFVLQVPYRSAGPQLTDVPTMAESSYPGFEMTPWYGLNTPVTCSK